MLTVDDRDRGSLIGGGIFTIVMHFIKEISFHQNIKYTPHEHRQTPTIFYLKLWTFAILFVYLDMEVSGLFGVFVDFSVGSGTLGGGLLMFCVYS